MELWKENETGVVSFRNVGWVWGDWGSERDMFLLINVWYYLALKGMYQMALELGYTNDADSYIRRMTSFKNAFNTHYWTGIAYRDSSYKGKQMIGYKHWPLLQDLPIKISMRHY